MTEVVSGELVVESLSKREQSELRKQELRIEKALPGFLELADALSVIRDGRLYRAEFGTFDEYVAARWDMSRQRVSQLTSAAETVRSLPPDLTSRVTTERAARVIRTADPKPAKLRKALDRVVNDDGTEGSAAALERALTPAPKVVTAVDSGGTGDVFGVLIAIAPAVAEGIAMRPRGEVDSIASAIRTIATALNARREADKPAPVKQVATAARKVDGKRQVSGKREVAPRPKAGK